MPTGYKVAGGADLDTLFTAGSGGAATGLKVAGGADLNTVFLPYATGAKRPATGYKVAGGADLADQFQNSAVPVADPLGVVLSTTSLSSQFICDEGILPGSCPLSSNVSLGSVTATVSGGVPPYTYFWYPYSTDFTASTPLFPYTEFVALNVPANTTINGAAAVSVTDAAGNSTGASLALSGRYIRFAA